MNMLSEEEGKGRKVADKIRDSQSIAHPIIVLQLHKHSIIRTWSNDTFKERIVGLTNSGMALPALSTLHSKTQIID